mmetsp:Transcript_9065/g.25322  ORF Transcript_9065/g.25322 Transcript_9065/m.25322 type:complete len:223 (+) Transcript_9065:451-1119(+)
MVGCTPLVLALLVMLPELRVCRKHPELLALDNTAGCSENGTSCGADCAASGDWSLLLVEVLTSPISSSGRNGLSSWCAKAGTTSQATDIDGNCCAKNLLASSTDGTMHSGQAACRRRCNILTMLTSAVPTIPVGFRTIAFPRIERSIKSPVSLAKAKNRRTWRIPGTPASRRSHITSNVMLGLRARLSIMSLPLASMCSRQSSVMALFVSLMSIRDKLPVSE